MFSRHCLKRFYSSKGIVLISTTFNIKVKKAHFPFFVAVKIDENCLPVQPTWSIQSLLDSPNEPISDEQFDRLLELARLNKPANPEKLKQDIDKLAQLTGHIKGHAYDVAPLRSIWKEGEGQILRSDDVIESDNDGEKRGRSLLKHAQKTSGNFYTVAE